MEYALRVEGLPILDFWDCVLPLCSLCRGAGIYRAGGDSQGNNACNKKGSSQGMQNDKMKLTICENNDATIKIVLKGRAKSMRHI